MGKHIHRGNLLLRCRLQALRSARQREALRRPQRAERGGEHIVTAARLQLIQSCLVADSHLVKFIANYDVYVGRMYSPVGRNAFFCCSLFDVKTDY